MTRAPGTTFALALGEIARPLGEATLSLGRGFTKTFPCFNAYKKEYLANDLKYRSLPAAFKKVSPLQVVVEDPLSPYFGYAVGEGGLTKVSASVPESIAATGTVAELQEIERRRRATEVGLALMGMALFTFAAFLVFSDVYKQDRKYRK